MRVFLEKRLVLDGVSDDVLEHDLGHGKDLLLGVGRVMFQVGRLIRSDVSIVQRRTAETETYPFFSSQTKSSKPQSRGREVRRYVADQTPFNKSNLKEVLSDGARVSLAVVCLAAASEPTHRSRRAQVIVKSLQNKALSLKNLLNLVLIVREERDLFDRRRVGLLKLGRDQERSNANQLNFGQGDRAERQESVNDIDSEEERLGKQVESRVHLEKPVDKNAPMFPRDLSLVLHVVGVGHSIELLGVRRDEKQKDGDTPRSA